ncbi:hypothetical protein [Rhizobium sp. R693]|uniref:hypothetical protein n=1 Tax=Rhizobium sp. R693 TaxID=1764276 RepID=UPI000B5342B9|nr:hypothetical protein [Rhizobium sp. R693]OWV83143.1 hypothetical protein ATY79_14190 [Rhizobium sp. R693]
MRVVSTHIEDVVDELEDMWRGQSAHALTQSEARCSGKIRRLFVGGGLDRHEEIDRNGPG